MAIENTISIDYFGIGPESLKLPSFTSPEGLYSANELLLPDDFLRVRGLNRLYELLSRQKVVEAWLLEDGNVITKQATYSNLETYRTSLLGIYADPNCPDKPSVTGIFDEGWTSGWERTLTKLTRELSSLAVAHSKFERTRTAFPRIIQPTAPGLDIVRAYLAGVQSACATS